jgi:hypothetical protein
LKSTLIIDDSNEQTFKLEGIFKANVSQDTEKGAILIPSCLQTWTLLETKLLAEPKYLSILYKVALGLTKSDDRLATE